MVLPAAATNRPQPNPTTHFVPARFRLLHRFFFVKRYSSHKDGTNWVLSDTQTMPERVHMQITRMADRAFSPARDLGGWWRSRWKTIRDSDFGFRQRMFRKSREAYRGLAVDAKGEFADSHQRRRRHIRKTINNGPFIQNYFGILRALNLKSSTPVSLAKTIHRSKWRESNVWVGFLFFFSLSLSSTIRRTYSVAAEGATETRKRGRNWIWVRRKRMIAVAGRMTK